MRYIVYPWPSTVYPNEADQFPDARPKIDNLLRAMQEDGPNPLGFQNHIKTLGKELDGLWQCNLKVNKKQIRILYAPYRQAIMLFHIHLKASPQDQKDGYAVARRRKQEYETWLEKQKQQQKKDDKRTTTH